MMVALPAALALVGLSAAPKGRLAVVELDSPPTMIGLAEKMTELVRREAAKLGYEVVPTDVLRERLGGQAFGELKKCAGSAACVSTRLSGFGVDKAVIGSLGRTEKHYLVKLWLLDLKELSVIADVDRAILIASRRLMEDVEQAVPPLLRGEREALGTLEVTSNVQNAAVSIDGEFRGATPLLVELKPGKHELKLEKKNYLPVTRYVTVEPKKVVRADVRMLLVPGARPEEEEVPPWVAEKKSPERTGKRVPPNAWVAGTVGLVALAGAGYFGVSAKDTERKLLAGFDSSSGVYQGTRRDALDARRNAAMANLLFGVAGAALLTGAALTLLSEDEAPPVAPVAGPSGGGVVMGGTF